jgi:S-adenosylmethionine hydrolase
MLRPVIALLTDFGTRDHYAGSMKGVTLGICPEATLVDITHEVPAQDIAAGALELEACYRYFPAGTIFLVVVDPGVGSARRAVAVEAGGYCFVGPDNGVLSLALDATTPGTAVELTDPRYAAAAVSRTFEGRDRFAPAAAWLARGVELAALGRPAGALVRLALPQARATERGVTGEVMRIDRFGNLITNIDRAAFERLGAGRLTIRVGGAEVSRVVASYADAQPGELCALMGSSNRLEIAARDGSAAQALAVGRGAAVHIASAA